MPTSAPRGRARRPASTWQTQVLPVANQISQLAARDAAFTGVTLDASRHTLVVYRNGGHRGTEAYAPVAVPAGTTVEFRAAP
jgi:hypothetical protein